VPWVILIGKLHWLRSLVEDFMRLFGQGCWKKVCAHSIKWTQFSGFACHQISSFCAENFREFLVQLYKHKCHFWKFVRTSRGLFLDETRQKGEHKLHFTLRKLRPFSRFLQNCTQFGNGLKLYAFQQSDLNGQVRSTWASWNSFNFHSCWACRCARGPPKRGKRSAY